ncbi:hypothetical protein B0H14DRAFT_32332 [Mycena olivaceomarginata]|nr:hypothetical protein B0H14DRAFT_32332 [Mycena olivaceomarginata]
MLLPPTNNARPGLLAFRNTCGRCGCGYVFEYDGADPLGNIHRLVREHSPLCGGSRADISFWRQPECPSPPLTPPVEEASFSSRSASSVGSGTGDTIRASSPSTATSAPASTSSVAATRLRTRRPRAREPSATPSSASGSSPLPSLPDADATGAMSDFSSAPGTSRARSGNEKSKISPHRTPAPRPPRHRPFNPPWLHHANVRHVQEDDTPRPEESILSRAVGEASGEVCQGS